VTIASPLIPRLQADTRQVDFLGALLSSSVSRRRMLVAGLGMVVAACAGQAADRFFGDALGDVGLGRDPCRDAAVHRHAVGD